MRDSLRRVTFATVPILIFAVLVYALRGVVGRWALGDEYDYRYEMLVQWVAFIGFLCICAAVVVVMAIKKGRTGPPPSRPSDGAVS